MSLLELEKEWFIEAPWGKICVLAWGDCADPPVLVCHGENDSAASFRPLLSLLPRNFYYIGMEFPGMGRSDRFPGGLMINLFDLVYPIEVVRKHFRWEQFIYMAHSVAGTVGRLYDMSYPGKITKAIELDMITPSLGIKPDGFAEWYNKFFTKYYDKYDQYNAPKESGPTYTWEQAIAKLEKYRGLTGDKARATLERWSEPAGDGRIRFTFDQRVKNLTRPPLSLEQLQTLFTSNRNPTLAVIASKSIQLDNYRNTPFLLDEKAFNGTYRVRTVEGTHDVHVIHPERVAPFVANFLLYGLEGVDNKAKL